MRSSLLISSLLPLLLLCFFVATPCHGQQNSDPFGSSADSDPFGGPSQKTSNKRSEISAKSVVVLMQQRERANQNQLNALLSENEVLKVKVNELEKTTADLQEKLEEPSKQRNEMHQLLFDSLFFSDDVVQQELALKHLIACIENQQKTQSSVSLYSVDVHNRLKLLTESKTETVREMAAGCLFIFHPSDATEMGIQFASHWKSLEHARSDPNTHRIHSALTLPCDMIYDETPLWEIVDELKSNYGIQIRLAQGVDEKQLISFESVGRTLVNSLAGLLESKKLGFAVQDEEIMIMKDTSPELNAVATYNVSGLDSLAQIKTEQVMKLLQEAFAEKGVEFSKVGEHLFTAKTDFKNQQQIQERIATLMPPPKWYSR